MEACTAPWSLDGVARFKLRTRRSRHSIEVACLGARAGTQASPHTDTDSTLVSSQKQTSTGCVMRVTRKACARGRASRFKPCM